MCDSDVSGTGGMEFLTSVCGFYPDVGFLVTTGVDGVGVGVQAMACGADDYLFKPLLESAVLASLERALHKQELEQQIENYRQHLEEIVAERTGQLREALQHI